MWRESKDVFTLWQKNNSTVFFNRSYYPSVRDSRECCVLQKTHYTAEP